VQRILREKVPANTNEFFASRWVFLHKLLHGLFRINLSIA
jgi:hypothetical protein